MATLDGSGREVNLGLGITVRAPGLRGSAPLSFIERRILNNGAVYGFNVQHDL